MMGFLLLLRSEEWDEIMDDFKGSDRELLFLYGIESSNLRVHHRASSSGRNNGETLSYSKTA